MILMIDDVKMVNADMFYPYVSKALAPVVVKLRT